MHNTSINTIIKIEYHSIMYYPEASVQDLLRGGGGKDILIISDLCVDGTLKPRIKARCAKGLWEHAFPRIFLKIGCFVCILVHFKVLMKAQLVTSYSVQHRTVLLKYQWRRLFQNLLQS